MDQEIPQEPELSKSQKKKLRKQEEKKKLSKKKQIKKVINIGLVITIFVFVVFFGVKFAKQSAANKPGDFVNSQGNEHIEVTDDHVAYNTIPPTSGPHAGTARWGVHTSQILDENQIHNLEDGGVGIQYNCDIEEDSCKQLVSDLKRMAGMDSHIFMGPYSGFGNMIALTAWQRIDKFDAFDEERILNFIDEYVGIDHHAGINR